MPNNDPAMPTPPPTTSAPVVVEVLAVVELNVATPVVSARDSQVLSAPVVPPLNQRAPELLLPRFSICQLLLGVVLLRLMPEIPVVFWIVMRVPPIKLNVGALSALAIDSAVPEVPVARTSALPDAEVIEDVPEKVSGSDRSTVDVEIVTRAVLFVPR